MAKRQLSLNKSELKRLGFHEIPVHYQQGVQKEIEQALALKASNYPKTRKKLLIAMAVSSYLDNFPMHMPGQYSRKVSQELLALGKESRGKPIQDKLDEVLKQTPEFDGAEWVRRFEKNPESIARDDLSRFELWGIFKKMLHHYEPYELTR